MKDAVHYIELPIREGSSVNGEPRVEVRYKIRVEVNLESLAIHQGRRAVRNKSKKSTACSGDVRVWAEKVS
jgi:hypothetical protein